MSIPVYYVGGSKGGVGKSVVSIALVDYLNLSNLDPLPIETDTANPDVSALYEDQTVFADLDERDGWLEMLKHIEDNPDRIVVINSAARANTGLEKYGKDLLFDALREMDRPCQAFWVVNRTKDSVAMLSDFLKMTSGSIPVHVVRNLYFGPSHKFELLNSSSTLEKASATGGKALDFPDLADRVYEKMNVQRMNVEQALQPGVLSVGDMVELRRWRSEAHRCFETVMGDGQ
jgi:hypothetical protein